MPKVKTKSAVKKRFKKIGYGRLKCKHSHKRHILTKKSTSFKRKLRRPGMVENADVIGVRRKLRRPGVVEDADVKGVRRKLRRPGVVEDADVKGVRRMLS